MAAVWKEQVLPKIKNVFGSGKKAAAAEATKSFDDSKETLDKEFEEKKDELTPKILEIYEAAPAAIKALVKSPTDAGLKKNSSGVTKFLAELAKTGYPGAEVVSKGASKFGVGLFSGPIKYIFEKVSTLVPAEEAPAQAEPTTETREIAVEETKKEEGEKVEETPAESASEPEKVEPPTAESVPATEPAKPDEPAPEPAKA